MPIKLTINFNSTGKPEYKSDIYYILITMKKLNVGVKILLVTLLTTILAGICFIAYCLAVTVNVKLDEQKLINFDKTVTIYDNNCEIVSKISDDTAVTELKNVPIKVKNAFVAIEDKRFYTHHGVDYKGMARALFNNIRTFSKKEGASTITQQLVKNTQLSGEKTLKRKIAEIKLAKEIEKKFTKNEILEKYLNTIYFGENSYGITQASNNYFGKKPSELMLSEGATLAGLIKAPTSYSPRKNYDKCLKRRNLVLSEMFSQNLITESEYEFGKNSPIKLSDDQENTNGFDYLVKKELSDLSEKGFISRKINVYTRHDVNAQNHLEKSLANNGNSEIDKTACVSDKDGFIVAFASTCRNPLRQVGSTIKPFIYASAVNEGAIDECSLILDRKEKFGDYSPSNYNEKYYGYVSAKLALAKSLNVSAVKVLDSVGVGNAISYLKKTDFTLTDNDNSLCLALGGTEKGCTLTGLCSLYSVFNNGGIYKNSTIIEKITDENGRIIYKKENFGRRIFEEDTIDVLNDMNEYTVTDGTAKNLKNKNGTFYAKTGTVGTRDGNTDAYTVAYTSDYIVGIRYSSKLNSLLNNNITGGGLPCIAVKDVFNGLYGTNSPKKIPLSGKSVKVSIDRISYEIENKVLRVVENVPKRFTEDFIFRENKVPATLSSRFSSPNIESSDLSVNQKGICIRLCQTELFYSKIFRVCNGKRKEIFDTKSDGNNLLDKEVSFGNEYEYYALPYFDDGSVIRTGKEVFIGKAKPSFQDDFWQDEFD